MQRIDLNSCDIEHIKPQELCKKEDKREDILYQNILACFPQEGSCPYGAFEKKNQCSSSFIYQLKEICEFKFIYHMDEKVKPKNENN